MRIVEIRKQQPLNAGPRIDCQLLNYRRRDAIGWRLQNPLEHDVVAARQQQERFQQLASALLSRGNQYFFQAHDNVIALQIPKTELASVSVLNMDDTGEIASAAAMAMMIFYTNVGARALHAALARWLERRTQAWRRGAV